MLLEKRNFEEFYKNMVALRQIYEILTVFCCIKRFIIKFRQNSRINRSTSTNSAFWKPLSDEFREILRIIWQTYKKHEWIPLKTGCIETNSTLIQSTISIWWISRSSVHNLLNSVEFRAYCHDSHRIPVILWWFA